MMMKCITLQQPRQEFYLEFSDCPPLDSSLMIEDKEFVVLKIIKHTKRKETNKVEGTAYECAPGAAIANQMRIYYILSTTIILDLRGK